MQKYILTFFNLELGGPFGPPACHPFSIPSKIFPKYSVKSKYILDTHNVPFLPVCNKSSKHHGFDDDMLCKKHFPSDKYRILPFLHHEFLKLHFLLPKGQQNLITFSDFPLKMSKMFGRGIRKESSSLICW